jgi:hypothetical protein
MFRTPLWYLWTPRLNHLKWTCSSGFLQIFNKLISTVDILICRKSVENLLNTVSAKEGVTVSAKEGVKTPSFAETVEINVLTKKTH